MGGVLPYRWGTYCRTNGRRIAGFPFLRSLEARKAYCRTNGGRTAVQIGGALPYFIRDRKGLGFSKHCPIDFGSQVLTCSSNPCLFHFSPRRIEEGGGGEGAMKGKGRGEEGGKEGGSKGERRGGKTGERRGEQR